MSTFKEYRAEALTAAVVAVMGQIEADIDLTDLSDFVVVEMEEINDLVVEDFEAHADGSVSIRVEASDLADDEVIRLLIECVESARDSWAV